jgi:hypothetical protein
MITPYRISTKNNWLLTYTNLSKKAVLNKLTRTSSELAIITNEDTYTK